MGALLMKLCSYPRCREPGEPVNAFGTPGGFVCLCHKHATAWDIITQEFSERKRCYSRRLQKQIMYRMFKDWIEQPAKVGYGDDGITDI